MAGQEDIKLGLVVIKFFCVELPCNLYLQIFGNSRNNTATSSSGIRIIGLTF
jgi:hypothetical protein